MKTKLSSTVISTRCYLADQSWYFERVTKFNGGITLKINIRRNAYNDQSYAHVSIWDTVNTQWNIVVEAPISECVCQDIDYCSKGVTPSYFEADHNRLLVEAMKIVF